MITWLLGAATISYGVALARSVRASKLARHILTALILTSTAFLDFIGDGKVDMFSSAYSLAAVYWLVNAEAPSRNRSLFILTGGLIGYACILRPHNVYLLGVFVAIRALQQWRGEQSTIKQLAQQIGWLLLGAVGFAIYHLLINKIVLGSPFAFWAVVTAISPTDGPWEYEDARNVPVLQGTQDGSGHRQ